MSDALLPGLSVAAGGLFATLVTLEVARHLHWRRHRASGFVPGTQHWVLGAMLVCVGFLLAGAIIVLWRL